MATSVWLEALYHHPIFAPSADSPQASTSSSLEPLVKRQRLALLRANELLVALGSQLRLASLAEAKSRADTAEGKTATYKTLVASLIDFEIDSLVVNPPSKLVAVVGRNRLVVVVLPRKGWNGLVGDSIECRAIEIGPTQLSASAIVQVRWHPWSANGATLLVLTSDGLLREYDVADDAERPAQTLDFCDPADGSRSASFDASFDLDADEATAVAFCIGSGTADWGPLTLYGLMTDGAVYSLCPYLPKAAAVPRSFLRELSESVAEIAEDAPSDRLAAGKLAHDLLDAAEANLRHDADDAVAHIGLPTDAARRRVARQGPYLLQPAPRELKGSRNSVATDIVAPSSGPGVLLVAYSSGKVDVLLDLDRPRPNWTASAKSAALPALTTVETLDLGLAALPQTSAVELQADPLYDEVVYVCHAHGVQSLDLSPWIKALDGDPEHAVRDQLATDVRWHLRAREASPLVGLQIVNDVYLGSLLVALQSSPSACLSVELDLPDTPNDGEVAASPARAAQPTSRPSGYTPLLPLPAFAPRPLKVQKQHAPAKAATPTESLQHLGTTVTTLRSSIRDVVLATNETQDRLALQLTELPRQLAKLADLRAALPSSSSSGLPSDRLDRATEAQRSLLQRLDRLLQRLMDAHRPGVSDAERAWFAELARMRSEVERGLGRRVERARETLERTRPRAEAVRAGTPALEEGKMGARQVRAVEAQLLVESRMIDQAKERLDSLQDRMARLAVTV